MAQPAVQIFFKGEQPAALRGFGIEWSYDAQRMRRVCTCAGVVLGWVDDGMLLRVPLGETLQLTVDWNDVDTALRRMLEDRCRR